MVNVTLYVPTSPGTSSAESAWTCGCSEEAPGNNGRNGLAKSRMSATPETGRNPSCATSPDATAGSVRPNPYAKKWSLSPALAGRAGETSVPSAWKTCPQGSPGNTVPVHLPTTRPRAGTMYASAGRLLAPSISTTIEPMIAGRGPNGPGLFASASTGNCAWTRNMLQVELNRPQPTFVTLPIGRRYSVGSPKPLTVTFAETPATDVFHPSPVLTGCSIEICSSRRSESTWTKR